MANKTNKENTNKARILIVEADGALAGFMRRGLEREGYRAEVLPQAAIAEIMLRQHGYALVIVDLATAGHDGLDLVRWIAKTRTAAATLVLIAGHAAEDRMACLRGGAGDCLLKPFSFAELAQRVRALLGRRSRAGAQQIDAAVLQQEVGA